MSYQCRSGMVAKTSRPTREPAGPGGRVHEVVLGDGSAVPPRYRALRTCRSRAVGVPDESSASPIVMLALIRPSNRTSTARSGRTAQEPARGPPKRYRAPGPPEYDALPDTSAPARRSGAPALPVRHRSQTTGAALRGRPDRAHRGDADGAGYGASVLGHLERAESESPPRLYPGTLRPRLTRPLVSGRFLLRDPGRRSSCGMTVRHTVSPGVWTPG